MSGENDQIAICSACSCQMDVSVLAPFTNVQCPECGAQTRVKCELDQYVLRRRQGVGGMSLVFAAKDTNLGREVAIKILNEDYSSDATRIAQFEQEAMITAGISHPHVVRVYTVGKAFNRYYIAMELVSGQSMEQIMGERGALPEAEVMPKMLQVTEGLNAAYKVGLIHRDIKPGNILIDGLKMAKIVDFGLALVTQGGVATAEEVWATPYYVPPEALDGQPEDFRSDVYALSATMYHALAGKPPFTAETRSTRELSEIKKTLPPLKSVAPWLSDATCAVIDKGMKYDPNDRFGSYDELLNAIQFADDSIGIEGASLPIHGANRANRGVGIPVKYKLAIPLAIGGVALIVGAIFVVSSIISSHSVDSVPSDGEDGGNGTKPTDVGTVEVDGRLKANIARGYGSIVNHVKARQYFKANDAAIELFSLEKLPEPSATMVGLHWILIKYLDGQPERARNAARDVMEHAQKANYKRSGLVKGEVEGLLNTLSAMDPMAKDGHHFKKQLSATGVALFLAALKHAELGLWDLAEQQLKGFIAMEFRRGREANLFREYQVIAKDYLSDVASLKLLQAEELGNMSKEQLTVYRSKVVSVKLKTKLQRGGWLQGMLLAKCDRKVEQFDKPVGPVKPNGPVDGTEPKRFADFLKDMQPVLKKHDFATAVALLEAKNYTDKLEDEKRLQFLYICKNAQSYYKNFSVNLVDKNLSKSISDGAGVIYSIDKVVADGIQGSNNGKKKMLKWSELDPMSLLKLHGDLTKGLMEFQQNRILENAACFAYVNKLGELADSAAMKLATRDAVFKNRWESAMHALSY